MLGALELHGMKAGRNRLKALQQVDFMRLASAWKQSRHMERIYAPTSRAGPSEALRSSWSTTVAHQGARFFSAAASRLALGVTSE